MSLTKSRRSERSQPARPSPGIVHVPREWVAFVCAAMLAGGGCTTAPSSGRCGTVGDRSIALSVPAVRNGEFGRAEGFGVMAAPGLLWTVAHLLPDSESGGITIDGIGSSFVTGSRQVLVSPGRNWIVGDWAEVRIGWLPRPDYGLESGVLDVASAVPLGASVILRMDSSEFSGSVVGVIDAAEADRTGQRPRVWRDRVVIVKFEEESAIREGRSGSPVLINDNGSYKFLGLISGCIEWPEAGRGWHTAVTRPPCRACP